jgi:hypothetical protein
LKCDILSIDYGDKVCWKWSLPSQIRIKLLGADLLYGRQIEPPECHNMKHCQQLDSISKVGIYCFPFKRAGVYYFQIDNGTSKVVIPIMAKHTEKVIYFLIHLYSIC